MVATDEFDEPLRQPMPPEAVMHSVPSSDPTQPRTYAVAAPTRHDTLSLLALTAVMAIAMSVWLSAALASVLPLLVR
jgi:hypothetical protein